VYHIPEHADITRTVGSCSLLQTKHFRNVQTNVSDNWFKAKKLHYATAVMDTRTKEQAK